MTTVITQEQGFTGLALKIPRVVTQSTLSQVTTAGWWNNNPINGQVALNPQDLVAICYSFGTTSQATALFGVTIGANGVVTLHLEESTVILPVVSGDFANFSGTSGAIADLGYSPTDPAKTKVVMANAATVANHLMVSTDTAGTVGNKTGTAINDGSLQAGRSTVAGSLISFPSTTTSGSLALTAVANSGNYNNVISNASTGQAVTWSLQDPAGATSNIAQAPAALVNNNLVKASGTAGLLVDAGIAAANVDTSLSSATASTNKVFVKTITASAAALATSGQVAVMAAPSGTSQFKIMNIRVMYTASGLSGGGGDRLLTLTDGTIVFNQAGITAALLGTPIYTLWGGTGNPIPGSVSTISTAGAAIYLVYSGGAADYTTGSVVIEVELAQVTA